MEQHLFLSCYLIYYNVHKELVNDRGTMYNCVNLELNFRDTKTEKNRNLKSSNFILEKRKFWVQLYE